jgi:hypothetical protein
METSFQLETLSLRAAFDDHDGQVQIPRPKRGKLQFHTASYTRTGVGEDDAAPRPAPTVGTFGVVEVLDERSTAGAGSHVDLDGPMQLESEG